MISISQTGNRVAWYSVTMSATTSAPVNHQRALLLRLLAPTWAERKRMFPAQAWVVVIASYIVILFAYIFPHDFRNASAAYVWTAWTAFMIRTFLFHLGLLLTLIVIVAAVARRRRLLGAGLPLVVFTVGPAMWSYLPQEPPPAAGETLTVMTVNLLQPNMRHDAIIAEIQAADPDIVFLQEYSSHWLHAFTVALGNDFPHRHHADREDCFGLAIYSRQPFVGEVDDELPLGDLGLPQARAVLQIDGRNVAFYNIHLMPPKNRAYTAEQRRAFADLLECLRREELPIILCGDFNFTSASPFADELERLGLIDVHRHSGSDRGTTWPNKTILSVLPGLRLDHIFISRELTSTASRTGVGEGSDHRPVVAEIGYYAIQP
ncbi:MAG: endonuclease/exonuclease/phosphatase family protein [Phycisphaerae bacterium]|nr:endonuclease/exonuclease/phosphatase family protein [Phycisphaerae bacterium]